jgi:hypothetical protein
LWLPILRLLNFILLLRLLVCLALLSAAQPVGNLPAFVGLRRRQDFSILRLRLLAGKRAAQRCHSIGKASSLGGILRPGCGNHDGTQEQAGENGEPTVHDRILADQGDMPIPRVATRAARQRIFMRTVGRYRLRELPS